MLLALHQVANATGDISGQVNLCDPPQYAVGALTDPGALTVYVPGRNYVLRPAPDGAFLMSQVNPGTYTINIEDNDGNIIDQQPDITVQDGANTQFIASICPDRDGDGIDQASDCDDGDALVMGASVWFEDSDGDTYGDPAVTVDACAQAPGVTTNNSDCYDNNADARPDQTAYFSVHRGDGSFDYDCNGIEYKEVLGKGRCHLRNDGVCIALAKGYWFGFVPACGEANAKFLDCDAQCKEILSEPVVQACR